MRFHIVGILTLLCVSTIVFADDPLRVGVIGQEIDDNDAGAWRNVRLHLTYSYSFTRVFTNYQIEHPWRYVYPYHDHIVYRSLEDTLDRGTALTQQSVSELNSDGEPGMGSRYYNEDILWCTSSDETPPGFCDSAEVKCSHSGELDLSFALPECGRFRVYYLVDGRTWNLFCGASDDPEYGVPALRTFMFEAPMHVAWCEGIDTNLVAYITSNRLATSFVDIDMGDCAEIEPVAGDVKIEFQDYVHPRDGYGEPGRKWLPAPGDSVGLVYKFTPTPEETPFDVVYHIWDMTMWKGECMNSPRFDDTAFTRLGQADKFPATTGFSGQVPSDSLKKFRFWDFTVAEANEYGFYVRDTLRSVSTAPGNLWPLPGDSLLPLPQPNFPLPQDRKLFETEIIAYKRLDQKYDTLWLKSLDYGAHCLVTVEAGTGKDRKMDLWSPDSAYVEDSVWTISVPFDYDGYWDVGVNYGDGMADAWEASVAKQWQDTAWVNTDIRYFRPFVAPYEGSADFDLVPRGREIDGDYLCNFAEYRGLMIAVDSTDTRAGHSHRRLDPRKKSVLVHVRNNMGIDPENRSVLDLMPGFIYQMYTDTARFDTVIRTDTLEVLFTDSIRFRPEKHAEDDQITIEQVRLVQYIRELIGRDINYNRAGAGLWYYGLGYPSRYPMDSLITVRAVTFWRWIEDVERPEFIRQGSNIDSTLGITFSWNVFGDSTNGATVPNGSVRTVVNLHCFELFRRVYASDSLWQVDFPLECSMVIAHEFGHSVGLTHPANSTVPATIMSSAVFDTLQRFSLPVLIYSDSSKSQISIKPN